MSYCFVKHSLTNNNASSFCNVTCPSSSGMQSKKCVKKLTSYWFLFCCVVWEVKNSCEMTGILLWIIYKHIQTQWFNERKFIGNLIKLVKIACWLKYIFLVCLFFISFLCSGFIFGHFFSFLLHLNVLLFFLVIYNYTFLCDLWGEME